MPKTSISANDLLANVVDNIVNPIVYLLLALAVFYFLWGVFKFIQNADSPDERKKGGLAMMWGVVGLFVMVTAYGILNLILQTIGK